MNTLPAPAQRLYYYPMEDIRVIDGDTIEGKVDAGFDILTRRKFRLRGVNKETIAEQGFFLNQELLDEGLAELMLV